MFVSVFFPGESTFIVPHNTNVFFNLKRVVIEHLVWLRDLRKKDMKVGIYRVFCGVIFQPCPEIFKCKLKKN